MQTMKWQIESRLKMIKMFNVETKRQVRGVRTAISALSVRAKRAKILSVRAKRAEILSVRAKRAIVMSRFVCKIFSARFACDLKNQVLNYMLMHHVFGGCAFVSGHRIKQIPDNTR